MATLCPICSSEFPDDARACPVCGYHMGGSTQKFTPLGANGMPLVIEDETPVSQTRELKVVRGPQTGVEITLADGTLSMGRDPRCDVFLNDMTVSRKHAIIEVKPEGCLLSDNNSFNGTWVNDRSIESCLLRSGDLIQIGAFCLVYREK